MSYIRLLSLSLSFLLLNPFVNFFNHFFSKPDKIPISYPEVILNSIENNYDLPTSSGQVTNLPWRNDMDFLKAKEKYDTTFLLASYCAVLKNPLPGEGYNVALASNKMKGLVLEEGEVFSMNTSLGPYSKDNGYKEGASYSAGNIVMTEGGGVCKIAGVAYNLAVFSDLEIVERYNHSMPINYLPYGQDATVFYGVKDLKFKNTSPNSILIWAELIDNRLYMAFYGKDHPPQVEWSHAVSGLLEPPIKYIENKKLEPGQSRTITEGLKGARVHSRVRIKYGDGSIKIKDMGISNYRPLPKIIENN